MLYFQLLLVSALALVLVFRLQELVSALDSSELYHNQPSIKNPSSSDFIASLFIIADIFCVHCC